MVAEATLSIIALRMSAEDQVKHYYHTDSFHINLALMDRNNVKLQLADHWKPPRRPVSFFSRVIAQ